MPQAADRRGHVRQIEEHGHGQNGVDPTSNKCTMLGLQSRDRPTLRRPQVWAPF